MASNSKFNIVVYTVAGCEACKIMTRLVKQAMANSDVPISIEEIGTDKEGQVRQRKLAISDFPTTVLWKDSDIAGRKIPMIEIIGTAPVVEIRKKMLQYLTLKL